MSYRERLQTALNLANKDRKDLAAALGVSVQAIGQTLRGESGSHTAENAAKAARFLRVDMYWLATGEGSPPALTPRALEIATKYDQLGQDDKKRWDDILAVMLASEHMESLSTGKSLSKTDTTTPTMKANAPKSTKLGAALRDGLIVGEGSSYESGNEPGRAQKQGPRRRA